MTELDDVLTHYGVKGMKWGVIRKKMSTRISPRGVAKKSASKEQSTRIEKKSGSQNPVGQYDQFRRRNSNLSDEQLRSRIKRIKLENEYRELTMTKNERRVQRGKKMVEDLLFQAAQNGLRKGMDKAGQRLFDSLSETASAPKASSSPEPKKESRPKSERSSAPKRQNDSRNPKPPRAKQQRPGSTPRRSVRVPGESVRPVKGKSTYGYYPNGTPKQIGR